MGNVLGYELPTVALSGFLATSWIYVALLSVIGFMLVIGVGILIFYMTFNKKIILFENVSGLGYQPTLKTRARTIRIGNGGEEIFKTLVGGYYVSAYGKKMGKGTYWYAKGQDGYWYNILLGDFDAKLGMLDIEPVDRDVRMFHTAVSNLSQQTYGKSSFIEKYGVHMMLFAFLVVMLVGFFIIAGKINEGLISMNNPETAKINQDTAKLMNGLLTKIGNVDNSVSGIIPAPDIGGG